ncbi:hypothetical protein F751_6617 [Auxenochlorella protothecoides]|uniref:Uncharacterized protein n=1 Tax=Auxenochlorella protothecoides TaxID=3075 RepID=A0A087SLQ6_AUXPR|nr:hypothetical protein F751_6617 [Auxenochlorella protothecoides]KFM26660.1 hypothetical protein F751_6617 [Auxenochlorella protothecoides]
MYHASEAGEDGLGLMLRKRNFRSSLPRHRPSFHPLDTTAKNVASSSHQIPQRGSS